MLTLITIVCVVINTMNYLSVLTWGQQILKRMFWESALVVTWPSRGPSEPNRLRNPRGRLQQVRYQSFFLEMLLIPRIVLPARPVQSKSNKLVRKYARHMSV